MEYQTLKHAHAGLAYLMITLFGLRAALSFVQPKLLQAKVLRIAPHVIDTLVLVSAVTLAVWAGYSPHDQPWLAAKLVGVVAYIGLAFVGLKKLQGSPLRAVVIALALATPIYMIVVAKTKLVWPF